MHHWPHHHAESVLNRRFLEPLSSSSTCLARKELFGRRSITSNHGAKSTLDKAVPIKMHMIFIDSPCMATSKYTKPIWNMEWHEKKNVWVTIKLVKCHFSFRTLKIAEVLCRKTHKKDFNYCKASDRIAAECQSVLN